MVLCFRYLCDSLNDSPTGQIDELRRAVELLLVMQKVGFYKTVFIGVAVSPLVNKLRSKQTETVEHYVKVIVQIAGKRMIGDILINLEYINYYHCTTVKSYYWKCCKYKFKFFNQ